MNRIAKIILFSLAVLLIAVVSVFLIGGKQYRFVAAADIRAPRETVFKYLTEPELVKKWVGGVVEIRPLTDDGHQVGAKSEIVVEDNGTRFVMEDEVLRSIQNESLTVKLESPMFDLRSVYNLQDGNGSTHLEYKMLARHKGVFRFVAPFVGGQIQDKLDQDVRRLKQVIETDENQRAGD